MKALASLVAAVACCALAACSATLGAGRQSVVPASARSPRTVPLAGSIVAFSVDTPQRAALAAQQGIQTTIYYGEAPSPMSALGKALASNGISVIDGSISQELYYWECHRTHTVAPPPKSYGNYYCATDGEPGVDSTAVVLRFVKRIVTRDAQFPSVRGYWVLDDWPGWDGGSAHALLQQVHAAIESIAPGSPAICGFAGTVTRPGDAGWDPTTAKNYSNQGCDAVGWYNYSSFGLRHPSSGNDLDWSMKRLLPAMGRSLNKYGWNIGTTPLLGIGQAWGGKYGSHFYQPGLSAMQMQTQARAFCAFGATSIAWYAYDDSGFGAQTETPETSAQIAAGITGGAAACKTIWGS